MNLSRSALCLPVLCASVGMLVACSAGGQQILGTPGSFPGEAVQQFVASLPVYASGIAGAPSQVMPERSSMSPDATTQDLLYVLDDTYVTVYSYPEGKLEGKLRRFYLADDACVDQSGNVYIVNLGYGRVFEYAHGGAKRLRDLDIPGAAGCSIDPASGNLAVAGGNSQGGVHIFKHAHGTPTTYTDPTFYRYYFCGYDNEGNLFVDGQSYPGASGDFLLAELPKGGSALKTVTVNQEIVWPGEVQWDGKHITVQDQGAPVIYQFAIYGSQATKIGTTDLDGAGELHQTWIQGGTVILPNVCGTSCDYSDVLLYKYPTGGAYTKKIRKGVRADLGVVVSLAPKRQRQ
jgi:hypothetical protein